MLLPNPLLVPSQAYILGDILLNILVLVHFFLKITTKTCYLLFLTLTSIFIFCLIFVFVGPANKSKFAPGGLRILNVQSSLNKMSKFQYSHLTNLLC